MTVKPVYWSKPSGEPTYQAANRMNPSPRRVPTLGKLYAVGTSTSTVERESSDCRPRSSRSALQLSAIIGSTTSTLPVAIAVMNGVRTVRRTSRKDRGVARDTSAGSTRNVSIVQTARYTHRYTCSFPRASGRIVPAALAAIAKIPSGESLTTQLVIFIRVLVRLSSASSSPAFSGTVISAAPIRIANTTTAGRMVLARE